MINTAWKIMFFWFFGTLTVFYHATFTPKHSKEQCHPLNKRVIILYLLQRQYKKRFQPNEWQSKWKEYTECLISISCAHKTPLYDARISNGLSFNVYIIPIGKTNPFLSIETVEIASSIRNHYKIIQEYFGKDWILEIFAKLLFFRRTFHSRYKVVHSLVCIYNA